MKLPLTLILLFALSLSSALAGSSPETLAADLAPFFADSGVIRHRVPVPSAQQPQGEVRIIQRGKTTVVQTLLYSKILKRVVGTICKKEETTWPQQRPGYDDAKRYVTALRQAREELDGRSTAGGAGGERLQKLLIEFVLGEQKALIGLFETTCSGEGGQLVVHDRRPIAVWQASRSYVAEDMLAIVKDSFLLDEAEAAALLALPAAEGNR